MNKNDSRKQRVLWFQAAATNNFSQNINGMVPQDARNIKVRLSTCYITYPDANIFNAHIIRILGDFGIGHNQFSQFNNLIQLGVINNPLNQSNSSLELITPNRMPWYSINDAPNLINFSITNHAYVPLLSDVSDLPPSFVNICLTFSYEI
jgi:hypothetical protein